MVTDKEAPYISTDPSDIKRIVTSYFQSSAGILPVNITISATWSDEFNPKDHINVEVYMDLMNTITESEFSQIVSGLPTNKASGPSTVSYESVKYAKPLCHTIIMKLLNACLHTTFISNSWRQALLFSIPKLMDWECHIDKTRLIVLLEIFRKLLSKILTQRLSNIFVQHHILKGDNYAGLSGGLTFNPIHTINLTQEDALRNNKEV